MATERLRVILEMVTADYKKGAKDAARATDGITKSGKAADKSVNDLSKRMGDFRKGAALAAGAAGAAALVATFKDSVRAASDLGESVNAVEKTFGDASGTILEFSKVAAQSAGLSASAFNSLATNTGALLTNFGFTAKEAANEAVKLTVRAADLASVFNTEVDEALGAVNAALRGETEPIRRFGISLSDATVRAKAVELGLADTTAAVDANGKAVAALELIYEQSAKAQGDFIQTNDSLANSARIAAAEWENAKAEFGEAALPIAAGGLGAFSRGLLMLRADFSGAANQSLRFKIAMDAVAKAVKNGANTSGILVTALFDIAENTLLTSGQMTALAAAAGVSTEALDDNLGSILAQARAQGIAEDVINEFVRALREIEPATEQAGGASEELGDKVAQQAIQLDNAQRAAFDYGQDIASIARNAPLAAAGIDDLANAARRQASPIFAAFSATKRYEELIKDLPGPTGRTTEQTLEVQEAFLDMAAALAVVEDSDLDKFLSTTKDTLGLTKTQVDNLRLSLEDTFDRDYTLGIISNLEGNTLARVLAEVEASGRSFGDEPRAYGGPVSAGRSYIVGERGPEFFTPTSSGRISSGPLGDAGGGVTINLNVTTQPGFSNQVVREMEQALARYRAGVS